MGSVEHFVDSLRFQKWRSYRNSELCTQNGLFQICARGAIYLRGSNFVRARPWARSCERRSFLKGTCLLAGVFPKSEHCNQVMSTLLRNLRVYGARLAAFSGGLRKCKHAPNEDLRFLKTLVLGLHDGRPVDR